MSDYSERNRRQQGRRGSLLDHVPRAIDRPERSIRRRSESVSPSQIDFASVDAGRQVETPDPSMTASAALSASPVKQAAPQDPPVHAAGPVWPAYPAGPFAGSEARPLLDASILISTVLRWRRTIFLTTALGAGAGVMLALSTPHKFYAENRLFIDPREVQITEDDVRNQQLSTEAMLAITDSQVQILSSTIVLRKVVADLNLARDPEFNGSLSAGGPAGAIMAVKALFSGGNDAADNEKFALETLRKAVTVSRDAKTFIINVGVKTRDAEKSALIANRIVATYMDEEGNAQSGLMERTSESINQRLNALRADLDAAEREVETFKAENDIIGAGGELIDDKQILALNDQLSNARAAKVAIKVRAESLAGARFDDIIAGTFPEELLSPTLAELRKQFAQTKASADALSTRLGPRHPQFIAAQSSLEAVRNEIRNELRRIVAASQTELQRAVETEQDLSSQLATAKSRAVDQSVEFVELRELDRKASATRAIYESFLKRSRETSERSSLMTRNIRIISSAEPPLEPAGPSRKLIVIAGTVVGMMAGAGLALLAGVSESIKSYNGNGPTARFQPQAWPQAPQPVPGPETPPTGNRPSRRVRRREEETETVGAGTADNNQTASDDALQRAEALFVAAEAARRTAIEEARMAARAEAEELLRSQREEARRRDREENHVAVRHGDMVYPVSMHPPVQPLPPVYQQWPQPSLPPLPTWPYAVPANPPVFTQAYGPIQPGFVPPQAWPSPHFPQPSGPAQPQQAWPYPAGDEPDGHAGGAHEPSRIERRTAHHSHRFEAAGRYAYDNEDRVRAIREEIDGLKSRLIRESERRRRRA